MNICINSRIIKKGIEQIIKFLYQVIQSRFIFI